jgi:hypothetical protein
MPSQGANNQKAKVGSVRSDAPAARSVSQRKGKLIVECRYRDCQELIALTHCTQWEEVMRWAEERFPVFTLRNPWIFCGSRQGKVHILLDPEDTTLELVLPTPKVSR